MKNSSVIRMANVLVCTLVIAACEKAKPRDAPRSDDHAHKTGHDHGHQAPTIRGVQALDAYADADRLHVLIATQSGDTPVLLHSRSEVGGAAWSEPVRVDTNQAPAHSSRRGMDPQIAALGDNLVAVWMSPGTDKWGGGPLTTALSHDGGRTWRAGPNPADDNSTTGHGFIDIIAAQGRFHLTWLDDRENQRGLRYATSADEGKSWSKNATIDPETCECCSNVITASTGGNVAILYRDRSPRDMAVAVSKDHGRQWRPPTIAGQFGWKFDGCPHAGGGLVIGGGTSIYSTVWTGRPERTGVYFVASQNLGESWNSPVLIAAEGVHSDVAIGDNDRLAAVWDTLDAVYGKSSADHGGSWTVAERLSNEGVKATHPRVIFGFGQFHVFWTEQRGTGPAAWRHAVLRKSG